MQHFWSNHDGFTVFLCNINDDDENSKVPTGFLLAPIITMSAPMLSAALNMICATALGGASTVSTDRCVWCWMPLASRMGITLQHKLQCLNVKLL